MKRIIAFILLITLCIMTVSPSFATMQGATGTMEKATTFYVETYSNNARIVLQSYTGMARVNTHVLSIIGTGTKEQEHHGFYRVKISGFDLRQWTPSATKQVIEYDNMMLAQQINSDTLEFTFNSPGTYIVTVTPMNNSDINNYWRVDTIDGWNSYPFWYVIENDNCNVWQEEW